MAHKPLVSIVTPSYNQGEFIEDTLRSVQSQTYENIEHFVIDGGSDDETKSILQKYEDDYNLHWISEPDRGHAHAVNKGFGMVNGDIVGWLNSDDIFCDTNVVADVVGAFEERSVDILFGDHIVIDEDNTLLRTRHTIPYYSSSRLLRSCFINQPSTFLTREVVETCDLDENYEYSLDYEYWLQAERKGFEFDHWDRLVAGHRRYPEARTQASREIQLKQTHAIKEKYGAKFDLNYKFNSLLDELLKFGLRIRGLPVILTMKYGDNNNFPIDIMTDSLYMCILRQLFYPTFEF